MMSPQAKDIRTFMQRTAASSIVQARLPVETRRAQFEAQRALIPLPPDVQVEAITAGSVAAEWVRTPGFDEHQVVLYVHGGGFVWGSCASSRVVAATFARVAQARVLVLDYRLAPEHPFPAAPQDCLAAYHWLLDSGVSPCWLLLRLRPDNRIPPEQVSPHACTWQKSLAHLMHLGERQIGIVGDVLLHGCSGF